MPILDAPYVKRRWAQWERFCTLDAYDPDQGADPDANPSPDMVLGQAIEDALVELGAYATVTEAGATNVAKQLALALAKKRAFDQTHGDDGFQFDPQILKDYKAALAELLKVRAGDPDAPVLEAPADADGDGEPDPPGRVRMSAKDRRFGSWLVDN